MGLLSKLSGADDIKKATQQQLAQQGAVRDMFTDFYSPAQGYYQDAQDMYAGYYLGDPDVQQQMYQNVYANPAYQQQVAMGEEAIARNASATGGLRSGGTNLALAQNSQNIAQGMINDQLRGYQNIMGFDTGINQIANTMLGMGQTQAQGTIAGQQAKQGMLGNLIGLGTSLAGMAFPTGFGGGAGAGGGAMYDGTIGGALDPANFKWDSPPAGLQGFGGRI